MNTQDRLKRFHNLLKEGRSEEAEMFVEENQADKRFVSLINLRRDFLVGLKKTIDAK